jgi:hypothetical protein
MQNVPMFSLCHVVLCSRYVTVLSMYHSSLSQCDMCKTGRLYAHKLPITSLLFAVKLVLNGKPCGAESVSVSFVPCNLGHLLFWHPTEPLAEDQKDKTSKCLRQLKRVLVFLCKLCGELKHKQGASHWAAKAGQASMGLSS